MKKIIILFLIFIFFGILFNEVYAQIDGKKFPYWGPIMSCNTIKAKIGYSNPCSSFCDLLATGQNALFFGITLALFVGAPILFVIIGFYYIISRGSVEKTQKAKSMFFNVIMGIVIILLSFVIINTFFVILSPQVPGTNFSRWNQIQCNPGLIPGSYVPQNK